MKNLIGQVSGVGSEAGRTLGILSAMKKLSNIDMADFYVKADKIMPTEDNDFINEWFLELVFLNYNNFFVGAFKFFYHFVPVLKTCFF